MSLDIRLGTAAAPNTYKLLADSIRITYEKSPIQIGLPGGNPPLLLDLGQFTGSMVITGIVHTTTGLTDEGINFATKHQLEDFVTDQWNADITVTKYENATPYYYLLSRIKGVTFDFEASKEDRWIFQLTLFITRRTA